MRLLIPLVILFTGMLTGAAVSLLVTKQLSSIKVIALAGGAGAFIGLLIRDVLDITAGGKLGGALVAVLLGALVCSLIATFLSKR